MPGRALLIGVSSYDSDAITDLEFVSNDLTSVGEALTTTGYDVTLLGGSGQRPPTHNAILNGVYDHCRISPQNEIVLLYFSGHGLHYQGRDYLVPADAALSNDLIEQVMVPVDFAAAYEQSRAASIFFFIDACREGIDLGEKGSLSLQNWSQGKLDTISQRQSAYVFACGAGEVSRYVPGPNGFSLFSRALADTLTESRGALTFGRVCTDVQQRLNRLADKYERKRQNVRIVAETGANEHTLRTVQISAGRSLTKTSSESAPSIDFAAISSLSVSNDDLVLFSQNLDGHPPWFHGRVSMLRILRGAATLGSSPISVLERLREYEPVGISVPDVNLDALSQIEVDTTALTLLPADRGVAAQSHADRISPVHLLYAASELGMSVDEVLEALQQFVPAGVILPQVDPLDAKGMMVDRNVLKLLSTELTAKPPWLQGEVPAIHVLRAANCFHEPVASIVASLRRFASFGISIADIDIGGMHSLLVTEEDLQMLSQELDGQAPWVPRQIPAVHVLRAAAAINLSVDVAIGRLNQFAAFGYSVPPIDVDRVEYPDSAQDLVLLSQDFDGEPPWLEGAVSGARVLRLAHLFDEPVAAIIERLRRFEGIGLRLPPVDPSAVEDLCVTDADMLLLTGGEPDYEYPSIPVTLDSVPVTHVLLLANRTNITIAEALLQARRLEVVGIKAPQFSLDAGKDMHVSDEDIRILSSALDGEAPWLDGQISIIHVLQVAYNLDVSAEEAVERLAKFSFLGFRVPSVDTTAIREFTVDWEDLRLLSRDLDGIPPWLEEGVTVTHLLRASNELGMPVATVADRLRRFQPMGIRVPDIDLSNSEPIVVSHDDLTVLSTGLDGLAPWITGHVPMSHVLYAAHTLDEPIGNVIERLRQFTGLGIIPPSINEDAADRLEITGEDLVLLSRDLDAQPPWLSGEVPVIHVLRAAHQLNEPIEEIYERMRKLDAVGVITPGRTFAANTLARRSRPALFDEV